METLFPRPPAHPLISELRHLDLNTLVAADFDARALVPLRDQLAGDLDRFWGGSLRRLGTPAGDVHCIRELTDWLWRMSESYAKDNSEHFVTEEWSATGRARASLYGYAASLLESLLADFGLD